MINELKKAKGNLWKINQIINNHKDVINYNRKTDTIVNFEENYDNKLLNKFSSVDSEIVSNVSNVVEAINTEVDKYDGEEEGYVEHIVRAELKYYGYDLSLYDIGVTKRRAMIGNQFVVVKTSNKDDDKYYRTRFTINIKSKISIYLKTINYLINIIINQQKYNNNLNKKIDEFKKDVELRKSILS